MKRSKMIEILEQFLDESNRVPEGETQELAEELLTFIESKGMKPPTNDHEWVEYGDDFAMKVEQYEWDKE